MRTLLGESPVTHRCTLRRNPLPEAVAVGRPVNRRHLAMAGARAKLLEVREAVLPLRLVRLEDESQAAQAEDALHRQGPLPPPLTVVADPGSEGEAALDVVGLHPAVARALAILAQAPEALRPGGHMRLPDEADRLQLAPLLGRHLALRESHPLDAHPATDREVGQRLRRGGRGMALEGQVALEAVEPVQPLIVTRLGRRRDAIAGPARNPDNVLRPALQRHQPAGGRFAAESIRAPELDLTPRREIDGWGLDPLGRQSSHLLEPPSGELPPSSTPLRRSA